MNIQMMQNGGGLPPFTYYKPIFLNNTTESNTSFSTKSTDDTSSKKKDDLDSSDLLKMIQQVDGLPSDLSTIYTKTQRLLKASKLGLPTSSIESEYLSTMYQLKVAKFNKERYKLSEQSAQKHNALSEIAISPEGLLIGKEVKGKGGLIKIDPTEYLNNKSKYVLYTNGDLLTLRSELRPNDNTILDIVDNNTSLIEIDKILTQLMTQLGTNSFVEEGMVKNQQQRIVTGLNLLQTAAYEASRQNKKIDASTLSLEGLYKAKLLTKDQTKQAEYALNYILKMLPRNAQTLLAVKAGGFKNATSLITQMIFSTTSNDFSFTADLEDDKDSANGKKNPATDETINLSESQQMVLGYGHKQKMRLNLGNSYDINVLATHNTLVSKSGDPFGPGASLKDLGSSQQSSSLMLDHATFGGSRLNALGLDKTAIDNNTLFIMELPIDLKSPGIIKPDLDLTDKLEQLDELMQKRNIASDDYESINQLCKELKMSPKYVKRNGKWELNNLAYARFAMIYTSVDSRILVDKDTSFNEKYVDLLDDSDSEEWFEQLIQKRTDDDNYDVGQGLIFGDPLYHGAVFIPVKNSLIQASQGVPSSSQLKMPVGQVENVRIHEELDDRNSKANYQKPPTLESLRQ